MKILTEAECKAIYSHLLSSSDPRDTLLQALFETGARISEILKLASENLNAQGLEIIPLKNSKPRFVSISDNLRPKLESLPNPWRSAIGAGARDSQRRALCRRWHFLTKTLLGRRINVHALRHTTFSRLYVATKDILLVKEWAGHKSINSTLVYLHLNQNEEANGRVQGLLQGLRA